MPFIVPNNPLKFFASEQSRMHPNLSAPTHRRVWSGCLAIVLMAVVSGRCVGQQVEIAGKRVVRIATFNASLFGKAKGEIETRLSDPADEQAKKIASIVQTVRPDILLINELDFDPAGKSAEQLAKNFFAVSQDDQKPIVYPHIYAAPSNTGTQSGMDINGNGKPTEPEDAFGYGRFPGQYAMAVFSRFPINRDEIRTFQKYRWKDFPNALKPVHPETGVPYYADDVWDQLRLSSKNHVDVPISIDGNVLHVLASHPTPPVFDGPEDHNGCRNHDEIRFWIDYIQTHPTDHLVDDRGIAGGLEDDRSFVIMGDLNSDPSSGDSRQEAIQRLLAHPRVRDVRPIRTGMRAKTGDPTRFHTASFGGGRTIRIDYVLPSKDLAVRENGVFWPSDDPRVRASDHRLVWVDVEVAE